MKLNKFIIKKSKIESYGIFFYLKEANIAALGRVNKSTAIFAEQSLKIKDR